MQLANLGNAIETALKIVSEKTLTEKICSVSVSRL